MIFLGIEVNTILLTLRIPDKKWAEIQELLHSWIGKKKANLKEVQVLAGSLNFACKCIHSGRVYLSRILNFLRILPKFAKRNIPPQVLLDINWWIEFATKFNGTALMMKNMYSLPDRVISSDSCLTGGGVYSNGEFAHWQFPDEITELNCDINQLECLMLVIAVKIWLQD